MYKKMCHFFKYSHYYKEWEEQQEKKKVEENDDQEGIPQGAMAHWLGQSSWSPSSAWYRQSDREVQPNAPYIGEN